MATNSVVPEVNLKIDLTNQSSPLDEDFIKSNPIYEKDGYIPYAIRRRMDLREGEEQEIVNDVSVNLECHNIRQYRHRKVASRRHIHDLLQYAFSKGTLITPALTKEEGFDPDKIVRDEKIYNQARMAWECAKYYIHNIIFDKVWHLDKCSKEEYKRRVINFIYEKDLNDFIMASLKLKHDPEIATTFSRLIAFPERNFFTEDWTERIVTYIFIGSRKEEFALDNYVKLIHKNYQQFIARLTTGFYPHEAGAINTELLDTEWVIKYGFDMIKRGYPVLTMLKGDKTYDTRIPRFENQEAVTKFMEGIDKEHHIFNNPARGELFGEWLKSQPMIRDYLPKIDTPPKTMIEALILGNEKTLRKYPYVTYSLWLAFNSDKYETHFNPEWLKENPTLVKSMLSPICAKIFHISPDVQRGEFVKFVNSFLKDYADTLLRLADVEISNQLMLGVSYKEAINKCKYLQPFIMMANRKWFTYIQYTDFSDCYKKYPNLVKFFVECFIVNKQKGGRISFSDKQLDGLYEKFNVDILDLLRLVDICHNIDFLKKHYEEKHFVVLPQECVMHSNAWVICKKDVERIFDFFDDEQMKTYPFPIQLMRKFPDMFKKYIDERNIDRYIYAYGVNWVEDHYPVSISDIVNSNSYVNRNTIERYLDVILLDDGLRKKFLKNKEALICHTDKFWNDEVFDSETFSNAIKCEVLFALILAGKDYKMSTFSICATAHSIIYGGGNAARALCGLIVDILYQIEEGSDKKNFDADRKFFQAAMRSPLLDIEEQ